MDLQGSCLVHAEPSALKPAQPSAVPSNKKSTQPVVLPSDIPSAASSFDAFKLKTDRVARHAAPALMPTSTDKAFRPGRAPRPRFPPYTVLSPGLFWRKPPAVEKHKTALAAQAQSPDTKVSAARAEATGHGFHNGSSRMCVQQGMQVVPTTPACVV